MRGIFKSVFTREYEIFRQHLRAARKTAGLSQEEVAERLNQTQLFVSRCELGDRKVDYVEVRAFCRAIGTPFLEFVKNLEADLENEKK